MVVCPSRYVLFPSLLLVGMLLALTHQWHHYPLMQVYVPGTVFSNSSDGNKTQALPAAEDTTFTPSGTDGQEADTDNRLSTCNASTRLSLLTDTCIALDLQFTTDLRLHSVIIDDIHRAIYIPNAKAGTKTMVEFLGRTIGESKMIRGNVKYFAKRGMRFLTSVSPDKINDEYPSYFTYLVVRHPLQKFVSGYYEKFTGSTKCRIIASSLRRAIPCDNVKIVPLVAFAEAVRKGVVEPDHHWSSVQFAALPCNVTLNMILKTETMTTDGPILSRHLGLNETLTPGYIHLANEDLLNSSSGFTSSNLKKYDGMLFELQKAKPRVFQWLLDYFRPDMDMFGYGWDPEAGSSSCSISIHDGTCC